jgi:hypothetical protein
MVRNIETHDIVFAAFLRVKGYPLDRIEKDGNRGIFCFGNVPDDVVSDFNLGKASVEPVAFNNAIRALTTATRRAP